MAESVNALFKTELYRNPAVLASVGGHWKGLDDLEIATCAWVSWFNDERLHGELNDRTPSEVEVDYAERSRAHAACGIKDKESPEYLDRITLQWSCSEFGGSSWWASSNGRCNGPAMMVGHTETTNRWRTHHGRCSTTRARARGNPCRD